MVMDLCNVTKFRLHKARFTSQNYLVASCITYFYTFKIHSTKTKIGLEHPCNALRSNLDATPALLFR